MQKAAKILDKILFRILPGIAFLVYFVMQTSALDEQFRAAGNTAGMLFTTFALVVFTVNLFIWIFFDEIILEKQAPATEVNWVKALLHDVLYFFATTGLVLLVTKSNTSAFLFENFVRSGAFYYGAVIAGDVLFILRDVKKSISRAPLKIKMGWSLLGLYFLFFLVCDVFTLMRIFDIQLVSPPKELGSMIILFLVNVLDRFNAHRRKKVPQKAEVY